MPKIDKFEKQFFNALREIFVGAKVEGDSGFINLMRIKSRYYEKGVFPHLQNDIKEVLLPFPDFREELFDKLYTFFQRYFSESGSIYFRYTALHQNVYEKVYTDDRDVVLFWKTHMLYYVKTDRIFMSMNIEVDGVKFFFDASNMTLKKANEKRNTVFNFRKIDSESDNTLVFDVAYTEKGKTTKVDDILKALKQAGQKLSDDTLNKAFRVFEKQSEVDYFINKNARAFLQEQFDLWMYQYLFSGQNVWSTERLAQLQALKVVANKVIDFISQFEDELVKIWNKPKFVRNSHYIITLDKLMNSDIFNKFLAHPNLPLQIQEWHDLGMTSENFTIVMLNEKNNNDTLTYPQYQYLPLDTKYFSDLELDILANFDNLDAALDGWLIHSENYQALNSVLPKFRKMVKAIYIDPPYNSDSSEIIYSNNYKSSSWLTILNDRLDIGKNFLANNGMIGIAIDDFEFKNLSQLMTTLLEVRGVVVVRSNPAGRSTSKGFSLNHEYTIFASNNTTANIGLSDRNQDQINRYKEEDDLGKFEWVNFRKHGGLRIESPKMFYPISVTDKNEICLPKMKWIAIENRWDVLEQKKENENILWPIDSNGQERRWKWSIERLIKEKSDAKIDIDRDGKPAVYIKSYMPSGGILPGTWWDDKEFSATDWGAKVLKDLFGEHGIFSYPKATKLIEKCLKTMSLLDSDIVLDFYAGSGTTAHAVMNLNRDDEGRRKYIMVEMGEHFYTVILPRIKKVAFSSTWKSGKANGGEGLSHFVKYYDLEQYEDVMSQVRFDDADLLDNPYEDPYQRYVFLRDVKMLKALDLEIENNSVQVHPERLYPDIDLAETLSQRRGKWIKHITKDFVEFQDGEKLSLSEPEWQIIKPFIWWQ